MKKAIDILYLARQAGVEILLNGNDLNVRIPKNKTIDKDIIAGIRANKEAIINVLRNNVLGSGAEEDKIQPYDKAAIPFVPLSFSQERLWFIHQMEGSLQYHLTKQLILKGKVDADALNHALKNVLERHAILRTVLRENSGKPYQHVLDSADWKMDVIDLFAENNPEFVKKAVAARSNLPFDLSNDYLMRASLFRLNETEHLLTLTMHHIAADGWSFPIVVREIIELYQRYLTGNLEPLGALPIQFADYSIWERRQLTKEVLDKKLEYWKEKLKSITPLQIHTDFVRSLVRNAKGASVSGSIDNDLLKQLVKLANQHGCTLYMLMLSVFKVLLYRLSNQQDICVGASIANRSRDEIKDLVGFFVNTLSFRSEVNGTMPFTELLQQVKKTTLEAFQHQDVPFEKVVEAVLKERDTSRTPVFQVMLVLNNTPATPNINLGGLQIVAAEEEVPLSKFDFTFFLAETANGLNINAVYSTDLFRHDTVVSMLDRYVTLLRSVVNEPGSRVGLLRMMTPAEEKTIVQRLKAPAFTMPLNKSVVNLFEEQVVRSPDRLAVVFEDEECSFAEMNARANKLAGFLNQRVMHPQSLIPVFLDRSVDMVISILAILKAGHAYVPIEVDLPEGRIDFLLKDLDAHFIVSNTMNAAKLSGRKDIEIIRSDDNAIDALSADNLQLEVTAGHLAYVIYTSGSTGKPKGVMIEHGSIVDYVWGLNAAIRIDECKSYALVSSFATDLGNTVVFSSLLLGGTLHILSKESVASSHYLSGYFSKHQIDCLKIVPSHWKALSQDGELLLPKKRLIFGGEALSGRIIEDIRAADPSCNIINHYGPTETTIGKLLHRVDLNQNYTDTIAIGKPFGNTRVLVLSSQMQVCPAGVPGQLYIAGSGVARGYLNNEELTRQKFIQYISGEQSIRMYATGDLVKMLPDGNILFLGRVDDQVKIRGYRVELGEIESVLRKMPGIHLCAVTAPADTLGVRNLIAYIQPEKSLTQQQVLEYLQALLPDYMLPAEIVFLEEMPLTINGKIDKKALPDPGQYTHKQQSYTPARNSTEQRLCQLWQHILEVEPIGIHDDFFALGGHSLLAVRLISLIRKEFDIEIPISHIFDYPTIALLSEQLVSAKAGVVLPPVSAVDPRPKHIPLSFSQERLWFIDKLEGSLAYHVPAVLRLKGKLQTDALGLSLKTIVNRHEVLRTFFIEQEGQVYQQVKEKDQWHLQLVDGTAFIGDDTSLRGYVQQLITSPFDLSKDDMLRATLITISDEEFVLVITVHHIASDGWSRSIIVDELASIYSDITNNQPVHLSPLTVQYADYAIWQRNYIKDDVLQKLLQYWKENLAGTETLRLPVNHQPGSGQSKLGGSVPFEIDSQSVVSLHRLSQQQGSTLFMTLLACFKVLLFRYTGQTDICIGTPIAGRQHQELENLIGFFLNTLVIRTNIDSKQSFIQYLQQVRAVTLQAYEHQQVPFEKIVEAVVTHRDVGTTPLFNVMFVLQNTPDVKVLVLGDVKLTDEMTDLHAFRYELSMFLTEANGVITGSLDYDARLYSKQWVETLVGHYIQLIKEIAGQPDKSISGVQLLSQQQKQHLLFLLNETGTAAPQGKTIIQLFEERVAAGPHQVALIHGNHSHTFQEINQRANSLANLLIEKGAGAGTIVPVYIERSVEMVIGLLAVAKTGAIYVPLDPDYPEERIQYIINDTEAQFVVTSQALAHYFDNGQKRTIIAIPEEWKNETDCNNSSPGITADSTFCMVYTSGSTGNPKGVKLSNANVLNRINWMNDAYPFTQGERVALKTSIGFVDHISEIFSPLIFGITGVIFSKNDLLDMELLCEKLYSHQVSRWVLVPSLLSAFIQHIKDNPMSLPALKYFTSSGELLSGELVKDFYKVFPAAHHKLLNIYGSSEVSADVTCYDTSADFMGYGNGNTNAELSESGYKVPIGKPIANCSIYLANKDMNLVPQGCYGEICVGGAPVGQGYYKNEELNLQKFINDPFNGNGGKIFRTGDIGRWLPDGNIEYAGRIDDQVKIRGNRVEPGEVENALIESGLIIQAAVVAGKDQKGNNYLVAYLVANDYNKQALISVLQKKIPAYMIPAFWVQVESLPLTPSGKIDKKQLLSLPLPQQSQNEYIAPRTATEKVLAEIWQHLLHIEKVGAEDNYFELGGHSLMIVKLVSAIRKQFSITVPLAVLFQLNTVAALAGYIDWELNSIGHEETAAMEVVKL